MSFVCQTSVSAVYCSAILVAPSGMEVSPASEILTAPLGVGSTATLAASTAAVACVRTPAWLAAVGASNAGVSAACSVGYCSNS